jgi:hypothetical protein
MSSSVYAFTSGEAIERALIKSRIIPASQSIKAKDTNNGLIAIKTVLKHWQAQGLHEWAKEEAILPLVTGQKKYVLGPDGDEACDAEIFYSTTLTTNQIATDTVIPVATTAGMAGAAGKLLSTPVTSTQDWTAINSATLAVVGGELEVTNGAAVAGGAEYTLTTVAGVTYEVNFEFTKGTSASADFTVSDVNGDLATVNLAVSGTSSLTFVARDIETVFSIENNSATINETSLLAALNYIDKASGDRIGIALDDGTRFWSNIVTVDSTTQVTINTALPSGATGLTTTLNVYAYGEKLQRPVRVLSGRSASSLTASEIPGDQWSREEYFEQSDKSSSGTVVGWYYSPQRTNGDMYLWQVSSSINQVFRFTYSRPLLIPTVPSDELDIPSEWFKAIVWAVAAELGPEYGIKTDRQVILESKAEQAIAEALSHDVERSSMSMQPDFN